jgi:hypothetical protein
MPFQKNQTSQFIGAIERDLSTTVLAMRGKMEAKGEKGRRNFPMWEGYSISLPSPK